MAQLNAEITPMILTHKYSLQPPLDWGDDCADQLFRMNQLWNRLVEIERAAAAEWRAVFSQDPDFAAMAARLDELIAAIDAAWTARKADRARTGDKTGPVDTAHADTLAALSRERSELWARMKAARTALKTRFKVDLDAVEARRRAAVKEARQPAQSGLWWGNYNAVVQSFDTARSNAMKTGGTLQFHRFDGGGRFTNQLQAQADDPPITVATLQAGHVQTTLTVPDHRGHCRLTITVYTGKDDTGRKTRRTLTFPMKLHRPIPPDAKIKQVVAVCRKRGGGLHYLPPGIEPAGRYRPRHQQPRIGDSYEWSAVFTLSLPDSAPEHTGRSACGLNLGWRQTAAGIRIATLVDSTGRHEHHHLPESVSSRLDRAEMLQSDADDAANVMRARARAWLDEAEDALGTPDEWMESGRRALQSTSVDPLARWVLEWKPLDFRRDWLMEADAWRKQDKKMRQEAEGLRKHAINHRRKTYEGIAKRLALDYASMAVGRLDLVGAARKQQDDGSENTLPLVARRNRQRAALHELKEWLHKQARKTGASVHEAAGPVTTTCAETGERITVPPDDLTFFCPSCGAVHDRDINAARNALYVAEAAPRATPQQEKPPKRARRAAPAPGPEPAPAAPGG